MRTDDKQAKDCPSCDAHQQTIDELKRKIKKLQDQQNVLNETLRLSSEIFQTIPTGFVVYQFQPPSELFFLSGNPKAARLMGEDLENCTGKEFDEMWPNARSQRLTEALIETAASGAPFQAERAHYRNGSANTTFKVRAFRAAGNRLIVALDEAQTESQESAGSHAGAGRSSTPDSDLASLERRVVAVLTEIEETVADALTNLESGYFSLAISAMDEILRTTRTAIKAGESINR
jgi:hypothetical protein